MILEKLLKFGRDRGYFVVRSIRDIDKSCCKIPTTEVIDFDKAKEMIAREMGLQEPKSCDGLKIMSVVNRLDFIEFKGFGEFKKHMKSDVSWGEQVKVQIRKFDLDTKIKDSFFVLDIILAMKEFEMTKEERKAFREVDKNYLIMVDIDVEENYVQNLALTLGFLSETADVDRVIVDCMEDELEGVGERYLVNKPRLIGSRGIDGYYGKVLGE